MPKNDKESIGLREEGLKSWRWVIKEKFDEKQRKRKKLEPDLRKLESNLAEMFSMPIVSESVEQ